MLKSFQDAHHVHGNSQKRMAQECGVTESTFYKWHSGRLRCPKHKRQVVDRALGAKVDWIQYDLECDAIDRLEKPAQSRPAPPVMGWGANPAPTPEKTETAPTGPKNQPNALEEMLG